MAQSPQTFSPRARISTRITSIPFLSMRRSPALVRRIFTQRFSLSTQNLRYCRFGRKRRLVLLFAWDTWCPLRGALPVTWQTRDIGISGKLWVRCSKARHYNPAPIAFQSDFIGFLEQSPLREGQARPRGHDEVVEHLDVDQRQRLGERARERLVLHAGLRDS